MLILTEFHQSSKGINLSFLCAGSHYIYPLKVCKLIQDRDSLIYFITVLGMYHNILPGKFII